MLKSLRNILIATLMSLPAACSYNPNDYSCFSNIDPIEGWKYGSTFVYIPEISDSLIFGQLALLVRHTNDYPYSNLWVEVERHVPAPEGHVEIRTDTFCIDLADVYGNWYGTGLGTSFQTVDTIFSDFHLANGAPIRLRHIMRPDYLTGIEQVGFIFNAKHQ